VARRPIITYRGQFYFELAPDALWRVIEEVDQYEEWWPWLQEFKLDGDALARGSVLHGVVAPPLPYRMRIAVELIEFVPPRRIGALVHGDLEGDAALEISESGTGSRVGVSWTVEMMQRPMRMASRFAHPLLQWGHDAVVSLTVAGFRRRLESLE
jgi:carbon monoxide dehydrogenase subunit G